MTVATQTNKIVYIANGSTVTFTFPFAVPSSQPTDILVYQTDLSGNITQLTYNTQYTVILNAASAPNPTPVGGSVTLTATPANGFLVTILRSLSSIQATSLANQGNLYQPVVEAMVDYVTMLEQQISELQGRAITVAVSDSAPPNLPPAAQRANQALIFDSSGNPTAGVIPSSGVISSAMAPFVASSTLAAAKLLLGYGSMANENIGAAGKGIADDGAGNARVGWTVSAVSSNQAVAATNHMTAYVSSGTLTHTLAKLTTLFSGFEIEVYCLTNSATLSPNAADTIQGFSSGAGVVITAGQVAKLIGDGLGTWYLSVRKFFGVGGTSTLQSFTSSTGTYTTPKGCTRIKVRMVGGGGGGAGNIGSAGNGTDTVFNSVHAALGAGGNANTPGAGGSAGSGSASFRLAGQTGGTGGSVSGVPGGTGGASPFGGGGNNGANAGTNTGSGGGGGAGNGSTACAGGGSGEYVELIINNPAATYTYTVGAGGTAGSSSGSTGTGAAGLIIVDEFYD